MKNAGEVTEIIYDYVVPAARAVTPYERVAREMYKRGYDCLILAAEFRISGGDENMVGAKRLLLNHRLRSEPCGFSEAF